MALKIVGSGLGRTGTKSLQTALNTLGFGPCHHMVEVFANPGSMALWVDAANGKPDWETIFANYRSMVDYPGAAHWRALADYYPDAKVIHTARDPDKWFESTQATIFADRDEASQSPPQRAFFGSFMGAFGDKIHDRAFMTDYFRRHTAEVKATIAPERLLIYEAGQGWEPLCTFLGAPIPETPYPSENDRATFIARRGAGSGPPPTATTH